MPEDIVAKRKINYNNFFIFYPNFCASPRREAANFEGEPIFFAHFLRCDFVWRGSPTFPIGKGHLQKLCQLSQFSDGHCVFYWFGYDTPL